MSIHRWLNWPKREASSLSPGDRVLVNAASQPPVPEDGNMNTCPVFVLKTFFRSLRTLRESSGNLDDRWSSIATIMARCTRSGTFVGPGTNRKFLPAMRGGITISLLRTNDYPRPRSPVTTAPTSRLRRASSVRRCDALAIKVTDGGGQGSLGSSASHRRVGVAPEMCSSRFLPLFRVASVPRDGDRCCRRLCLLCEGASPAGPLSADHR